MTKFAIWLDNGRGRPNIKCEAVDAASALALTEAWVRSAIYIAPGDTVRIGVIEDVKLRGVESRTTPLVWDAEATIAGSGEGFDAREAWGRKFSGRETNCIRAVRG